MLCPKGLIRCNIPFLAKVDLDSCFLGQWSLFFSGRLVLKSYHWRKWRRIYFESFCWRKKFLPWPKCLSEVGGVGKRWLFLVWGLPKLVGGCMMSAGQTASKLLPTSGWWSPNDALANIDRADHNAMHSPNAPTRHHVQPGFAKEPLHVFPPKYSWQTHRSKLKWELGGRWLQLVREPPEPPWSLSDGIPVKREGVIRSPSLLLPMRTSFANFGCFGAFGEVEVHNKRRIKEDISAASHQGRLSTTGSKSFVDFKEIRSESTRG